jgi:hypothetical protein
MKALAQTYYIYHLLIAILLMSRIGTAQVNTCPTVGLIGTGGSLLLGGEVTLTLLSSMGTLPAKVALSDGTIVDMTTSSLTLKRTPTESIVYKINNVTCTNAANQTISGQINTAQNSVLVTVYNCPDVSITGSHSIIKGDSATLTLTAVGGIVSDSNQVAVSIKGPDYFAIDIYEMKSRIYTFKVAPDTTTIYRIRGVTCGTEVGHVVENQHQVTVTVLPAACATVGLMGTQTIDTGMSATLTLTLSAGTLPATVGLSDGTNITMTTSPQTFVRTPTATTTYTLLTVTCASGPGQITNEKLSAKVTVLPPNTCPDVGITGSRTITQGDSTTLTLTAVGGILFAPTTSVAVTSPNNPWLYEMTSRVFTFKVAPNTTTIYKIRSVTCGTEVGHVVENQHQVTVTVLPAACATVALTGPFSVVEGKAATLTLTATAGTLPATVSLSDGTTVTMNSSPMDISRTLAGAVGSMVSLAITGVKCGANDGQIAANGAGKVSLLVKAANSTCIDNCVPSTFRVKQ